MAKKIEPPSEESSGGPGAWIVSFNDCMTNLLCFFVLLVSFSSFDKASRSKISGSFRAMASPSVFDAKKDPKSSVVPPEDRIFDHTVKGSEHKPKEFDAKEMKDPLARPQINSQDVYRDRKVLSLASAELFPPVGSGLTAAGAERLRRLKLVELLRELPCQVVISEVASSETPSPSYPNMDAERAQAIVEFLVAQGLGAERFSVSQSGSALPGSYGQPRVMEIVLLKRSF